MSATHYHRVKFYAFGKYVGFSYFCSASVRELQTFTLRDFQNQNTDGRQFFSAFSEPIPNQNPRDSRYICITAKVKSVEETEKHTRDGFVTIVKITLEITEIYRYSVQGTAPESVTETS